jgi:hypothetical protein
VSRADFLDELDAVRLRHHHIAKDEVHVRVHRQHLQGIAAVREAVRWQVLQHAHGLDSHVSDR